MCQAEGLIAVLDRRFGSQKRGTHVHGRILVLMGRHPLHDPSTPSDSR